VNIGEPWPEPATAQAWVLDMQCKLYRWARDDPHRRFSDLANLVYDRHALVAAWHRVASRKGAHTAGVDGATRGSVERRGVERFLDDVRDDLVNRSFQAMEVKEKLIPKRDGGTRRLGVPALRDRVAQEALRGVIEPIFEAGFGPQSYGFRPGRRAHDAIAEIVHLAQNPIGYDWVIEGDIHACFDEIPHWVITDGLRTRISDKRVMAWCRTFLTAGVMTETGDRKDTLIGTPQGGVISPLFANIALDGLDRFFDERQRELFATYDKANWRRHKGLITYRMIRYADDFVVMIKGPDARPQAEVLRDEIADHLSKMGLKLNTEKTRITHLSGGIDFLGYTISKQHVPGRGDIIYTYPSRRSLEQVKDRVRELTASDTTNLALAEILYPLNTVLRGWAAYFRFGSSKRTFSYLGHFAWRRVIRWIKRKHPSWGWKDLQRSFPDWEVRDGGLTLYNPERMPVERYRYRGQRIAHPWNTHEVNPDEAPFRKVTVDDADQHAWLEEILTID
jgi:RNA-directed DNA polymerase